MPESKVISLSKRAEDEEKPFFEQLLQEGARKGFAPRLTQSIFRPASRREWLGKHTKDDRRDAGLKMGWTKPLPSGWPMGIDCRLDLGRGSDVRASVERV